MKTKINLPNDSDDPKVTAARSAAEIVLISAATKAAVLNCLKSKKLSDKLLPPSVALAEFLTTKDPGAVFKLRLQSVFALGEQLDKLLDRQKAADAESPEEPAVAIEKEEPSAEAFAPVEDEPAEPYAAEATESKRSAAVEEADADEDSEESSDASFASDGNLEYIDVMDEPDAYRELLAKEKAGEVRLVSRFRRSYESRLIQSKDPMQDYYNGIKNALLAYKGVKSRISFANETFHQGRNHIAKVNVKTSSLYLYLALDPATLADTKYETAVTVLSGKKKFETVPVLLKIRGERKYKYALELIRTICEDQLQLPPNKNFEEEDYRRAAQSDDELVKTGLIRKLVATVPVNA